MKKNIILISLFIIAISAFTALGEGIMSASDFVKINLYLEKQSVSIDEEFQGTIELTTITDWYTYGTTERLNPEGIGPTPTEFYFEPDESVEFIISPIANKTYIKYDEGFEIDIDVQKETTLFYFKAKAKKNLDFSSPDIKFNVYAQLCDTVRCLPPDSFVAEIEINADKIVVLSESEIVKSEKKETAEVVEEELDEQAQIEKAREEGAFAFLYLAMTMGALALLTPCVFPMVPITVSFFTKRAEKGLGNGLRDSVIYALGIILTFTGLGVLLAAVVGASGIRDFAVNPWINLFIAGIFIVFAFNLFGSFEIQIPTGLMNKLNQKSQGGGITSVLLMGLTFSLTSFTCTVPFVGSSLIYAAQGDWFQPILGMLGFSTVFAIPFFLLSLFPNYMKKLPRSGGWMNNIKVVMGFLEIAAALKFISNADLVWSWGVLPRELFLSIWIAISILITVYILGLFKFKMDSPLEKIGAPRAMFAVMFLTISISFFPGIFGKPIGELDAFLPPMGYLDQGNVSETSSADFIYETKTSKINENVWIKEYYEALAVAKAQNKVVFIDFTGWTCTNCRWMESNIFPDREVQELFSNFVLAKLYTDRNSEPELTNKKAQMDNFKSIDMPLYVLMKPDGEIIAKKAFTRNKKEFVNFLKRGL